MDFSSSPAVGDDGGEARTPGGEGAERDGRGGDIATDFDEGEG